MTVMRNIRDGLVSAILRIFVRLLKIEPQNLYNEIVSSVCWVQGCSGGGRHAQVELSYSNIWWKGSYYNINISWLSQLKWPNYLQQNWRRGSCSGHGVMVSELDCYAGSMGSVSTASRFLFWHFPSQTSEQYSYPIKHSLSRLEPVLYCRSLAPVKRIFALILYTKRLPTLNFKFGSNKLCFLY